VRELKKKIERTKLKRKKIGAKFKYIYIFLLLLFFGKTWPLKPLATFTPAHNIF